MACSVFPLLTCLWQPSQGSDEGTVITVSSATMPLLAYILDCLRCVVPSAVSILYKRCICRINGRFEAQLHDHTARQSGSGKGDQVYLGVYVDANKAAMAYDRAALRLFGRDACLNVCYPLSCC